MAPVFYQSMLRDRTSQGVLSIRGYMMLLIAAILLPMLTLVAIVAWEYGTAARHTIEAQRLDVANNLRILIDREIDHTAGFLDGLSNAPGLRNHNAGVIERVSLLARERGFQAMAAYDLAGNPLFTSPEGSQVVPAESIGLAEIKAGRRIFVSNLIANAGEKPGLYFVSVPMFADGQVVAVLTGGLPAARLQRLFEEAGLKQRQGWSAGIVDRTGILLARSKDPEKIVGLPAQRPMYDFARGTMTRGLYQIIDRDGINVKDAFERSATSSWSVSVAVPTVIVDAPLWHSALTMTVIGVVLTLVSLLLAFMVASHLSRAIQRLGIAAVAIASGDVVRTPASNIAELRDVSRSIEVTGAVARRSRRGDIKSVS
jgi:HAMP domain-containing protein